jgi:hypothetical protein
VQCSRQAGEAAADDQDVEIMRGHSTLRSH